MLLLTCFLAIFNSNIQMLKTTNRIGLKIRIIVYQPMLNKTIVRIVAPNIKISRNLRLFSTIRSIFCAIYLTIREMMQELLSFLCRFSEIFCLTCNILKGILAREIIQTGICCIWCGEHDGFIDNFTSQHFSSKWPPYRGNVNFVRFQ